MSKSMDFDIGVMSVHWVNDFLYLGIADTCKLTHIANSARGLKFVNDSIRAILYGDIAARVLRSMAVTGLCSWTPHVVGLISAP